MKKGSKVYVEGSLRTRKWQDKDGSDRYSTEIVGNEMQMLDSRDGGADVVPAQQQSSTEPEKPAPAQQQSQATPELDYDIPY